VDELKSRLVEDDSNSVQEAVTGHLDGRCGCEGFNESKTNGE
jgi:hypothetical protein